MAQQNPWEIDWTQAQSAPAPAAPAYPGVIQGRPKAPTALELEDQQLQRAAAARADAQLQLSQAAAARADRTEQRNAATVQQGSESERTAGFLAGRVVDAVGRLAAAAKADPASARPTLGVEMVRSTLGDTAANYVTDAEHQQVRAAQIDILDAALTLGTGAAYTKEQIEGYREAYFPKLGDSPETVASKQQALKSLLVNARTKAGRAAPDIEKALASLDALGTSGEPAVSGTKTDDEETGLQVTVTDDTPQPIGYDPRAPYNDGPRGGRGGLMDLANQGITLGLADEAQGLGGYISAFLTGEDPQAAYVRDRDIARRRVGEAREDNPILGTAMEVISGGGALRMAGTAANTLRSVVRQGAGIGALGGYGYGEGARGSVSSALGGAALGAGLGAALHGAGRGVAALADRRRPAPPTPEQVAVIEAGERQGVPIRQPDVRPELRNRMASAETSQTAGPIIRQARAADEGAIEQRVAALGDGGNVSDPFALGTQVQAAGNRYIARTRQQASRMYDRAREAAGDATVQPREAVAAVDRNIAELQAAGENSNAGQIAYLRGLRDDLNRPLSVEAVQSLRTNMRGQISERGLTGTDAERRVAQVLDGANADLVRELPQEASSALRAADAFYRERQTFINDTLKQFMGNRGAPLPAETAASRLVSMTKGGGNFQRFSSMWKQLEPDEQADVAATVAESLGRKRNGEFSVATLVQSLDPAKGINPRTARLIFGEDGARALNDLRAIARAKTETQGALNNSRTGAAVDQAAGGLKNLLLGVFGMSQGGIGGAVALPLIGGAIRTMGERRAARMLLNPDFTRWLRNAPNSNNPRVIDRYFSRLAGISSIPANDNQAFTAALREAFAQSPRAAAAGEQERD